jgi:1-acyl-sn-glycerol-3-phosphate acyltransferase
MSVADSPNRLVIISWAAGRNLVVVIMSESNPTWRFRRRSGSRSSRSSLPTYHLPIGMLTRVAYAALRRERRDAWQDAITLVAGMSPKPCVEGLEHVPSSGPCLILPNHYERTDAVWVGWGVITISAALASLRPNTPPIRWVMTDTWADCYVGPRRIASDRLRRVLKAFASVYDLILMPAHDLPTHATERFRSGIAVRTILRAFNDPSGQTIALHPEAGGFETMIDPPPGMGRLLAAVDCRGVPCIPVGVFEHNGRITVRFGSALPRGSLEALDDREAASVVLRAIACLVPPDVRGVWAPRLAAAESERFAAAPALHAEILRSEPKQPEAAPIGGDLVIP